MNWTENTLYRHNRGRLRKINPARQRQKEYFARARARKAEQKAAKENGPPSVPYFRRFDPSSSQLSHGSNRSSSSGRRPSQTPTRLRETPRTQTKTEPTEGVPLPTISHFFQERAAGQGVSNPTAQYSEEALERMRQKLLSKKD
jgi:hypothetical protein